MSETRLRIVCGSMPCSVLYASWIIRRRWVSLIAVFIESVTASAYIRTVPSTLRAARPIVWISDVSERRNPSLSASRMADERDLGQVESLAQQVDADEHVELPQPQVAEDLDPLDRVDLRVEVPHADPHLDQVVRQVLRHLLRERGDQHALVVLGPAADLLDQVVDLALRRPDLDLRIDQPGGADDLLHDPLRRPSARRRPASRTCTRPGATRSGNSSNRSGRLSIALGSRNPKSTSVRLPRDVALVHAVELRHRHVRLVDHDEVVVRGSSRAACTGRCPAARPSMCRE